jgi:formylglycine-generating enzyme required for sulfatase activity
LSTSIRGHALDTTYFAGNEERSVMSRMMPWLFVAALAGAGGCARSDVGGPVSQAPSGEMILIPAGSFTMGDPAGRPDEAPHTVSVESFYLDKYPVSQELYEQVLGVNPSKHKGKNNPVERTQWTDAVRFCNKASELEGLTPCYNLETWACNFDANGYRLPTEAEWEYACRAGGTGTYCFGDDSAMLPSYAWFKANSQGKPRPLGQKQPNRWGLCEMHGNVWQWCNDWYGESGYQSAPGEYPRGPATGKMRVLRGGAWDCTAEKLRSAYRHKEFPVYSDACFGADSYGFRRARKAGGGDKLIAQAARTPSAPIAASPRPEPARDVAKPAPGAQPGSSLIDPASLTGTIVFVSDRGGTMKIWSMHASGKAAKQLTKGAEPDADPCFSPDGRRILFTTLRGGFPEIWLMNRDGSESRFVTKGSQASWAPDGQSIVFIEDNQTFIRDLTSGKERRVTPKEWERCGVPAFAPDGKHFAVASRHLGDIAIFILGLDGRENDQLKAGAACCTPRWSKDGKRILCQTVQGHIHQVEVGGKNWEQLTYGADVQHDPRYSPDGTMILFCRAPTPEGPWQICVKELDDDSDDFLQLTREGSNLLPDWHPSEE